MPSVSTRWLNLLLAATAMVSAWLLFQVQPIVAKRILPWFGGGTAVWTTTMLFFQSALFAGYLYAHLSTRLLRPRPQAILHAALLATAAALATAGVIPGEAWKPADSAQPTVHILAMLAANVGLPFVMLAATAPLVQVWFAGANPGASPYRLYALSNVGSLAALLSYPLLVEPNLGVARQGATWAALFCAFAALCAASGLTAIRAGRALGAATADNAVAPPLRHSSWEECSPRLQAALWLALPACASVALLAVTNYLCQDIASIPLLWIVPLATYLVTFILTFDSDRWYRRAIWMPLAAVAACFAVQSWYAGAQISFAWQLTVHITLLAGIGMVCHGELARMRPAAERLTAYYLCISAGGALGGVLAAVIAPLVLPDAYELHIAIVATWLLALAALVLDRESPMYDGKNFRWLVASIVPLAALATAMGNEVAVRRGGLVASARNFYGVLRVSFVAGDTPAGDCLRLTNGRISHGAQFTSPNNRRVPTQYYHAQSGVGDLLLMKRESGPRRIGVAGLGVGTLAAYAEPGDEFVFYEINPTVIDFAESQFSFLPDARARSAHVMTIGGDARLSLDRESSLNLDALILDAFNGDSIPAHLLTREAFDLYLRHIKPDGALAIHISNLHLDLAVVVKAAAHHFKLDAAYVDAETDHTPTGQHSTWILLHRQPGYFAAKGIGFPLDEVTADRPAVAWTDDYSNVLGILKQE